MRVGAARSSDRFMARQQIKSRPPSRLQLRSEYANVHNAMLMEYVRMSNAMSWRAACCLAASGIIRATFRRNNSTASLSASLRGASFDN
jgi:hypothetical protein